ncbi:Cell wall protein ecm33 [Choanephora cucurbitarum]|uniref:Cell wall protein ecm33 n=1 Tax=Choanephora cucurbitarum TaxID=101091 RepID=A0A1C7NPB6_9FUNG|nr:Cell wall protein ecm33 [Choanephora cucurbitarum]
MTKLLSLSAVLLLASASFTSAQAGNCERNVKVVAQAHLDEIKSCKNFKGTIEISQMPEVNLRMAGVEEITGELIVSGNSALQSFSAPELKKVDGSLRIENHTLLNKLELPQLTEVKTLWMSVLPALQTIQFPAGLSKANIVRIEDTRAPKIDGFKPEKLESFTLTSNKLIKTFDFSSVKEVSGDMLILGNSPDLDFQASQLTILNKASFSNMEKLSLPALNQVRSDLSIQENYFTSLNMDSVERIGGTIAIANNDKLTETSFKNLGQVTGALSIGNNTQLTAIDGFPKLSEVHGTIDLAGGFNTYSLPALQDVRGGMRLQTTSNQLTCSDIERKLKGEHIVKGNAWSCSASMQESNMVPTVGQNPTSSTTSGTTSSRSSSGSGASIGGADVITSTSSSTKLIAGQSLLVAVFGAIYATL